jgi:hypothetical protein
MILRRVPNNIVETLLYVSPYWRRLIRFWSELLTSYSFRKRSITITKGSVPEPIHAATCVQ